MTLPQGPPAPATQEQLTIHQEVFSHRPTTSTLRQRQVQQQSHEPGEPAKDPTFDHLTNQMLPNYLNLRSLKHYQHQHQHHNRLHHHPGKT